MDDDALDGQEINNLTDDDGHGPKPNTADERLNENVENKNNNKQNIRVFSAAIRYVETCRNAMRRRYCYSSKTIREIRTRW